MLMYMSTAFWVGTGFTVFAGGVGYYIGQRGWTGVQNDINNIKSDVQIVKAKL